VPFPPHITGVARRPEGRGECRKVSRLVKDNGRGKHLFSGVDVELDIPAAFLPQPCPDLIFVRPDVLGILKQVKRHVDQIRLRQGGEGMLVFDDIDPRLRLSNP